jgi:mannose-6-phosphate isomerase-like protein (cupin superfamily)
MKYIVTMAAALLAAAVSLTGESGAPVTYVDHDKVSEAFAKGTSIAKGPDHVVSGARRTGPGQVEIHEKETDVFYIVDGEATFVTGGKMIGGKQTKEAQWLGTNIEGGETHHLTKGDIIVIPAGTPHWFKEVPKSINYYLVKSIRP